MLIEINQQHNKIQILNEKQTKQKCLKSLKVKKLKN